MGGGWVKWWFFIFYLLLPMGVGERKHTQFQTCKPTKQTILHTQIRTRKKRGQSTKADLVEVPRETILFEIWLNIWCSI